MVRVVGHESSDRYIYNVDANGVALAAIQALYGMLQQKEAQLDSLRAQVEQLKQAIALPKVA